uniref:LysR family transcriptional regulator n=1 Tax=Microbulbifer agarilyticus TaxID=260552 RepID=UPI000255B777|nr:LysR family transcriptional regulator [Microbulbifer agarilyticus]
MNLERADLNLLVYLDVLLRERNVTRAASHLGLSQPAMSNGLKRLRELFGDPLLVRTREGMMPTERAMELQPMVREALAAIDQVIQPNRDFNPIDARRTFRIMASDYAESTLIPPLLKQLRVSAPGISLDIMTPSDVSFVDVEQGKVDMVINRFDSMPQSFHQATIWSDTFSCVMRTDNPILQDYNLESYLASQHIWVSKTGMGVGVGVNPEDVQRLGWVDEAIGRQGRKRDISVFTRHYQVAMLLAEQSDLIVTVPTRMAQLASSNPRVVLREPPIKIPLLELKMAWSPLLQQSAPHRWMRRLILDVGRQL